MKWIIRYIKGAIDVGFVFKKDVTVKQMCIKYIDSDYAEDLDKCRSATGYVFTLSQALVSRYFTLQSSVALSTMEAEYMAMTEAMKEAIWLQKLFDDLEIDHDLLKINCDSMSAIYLTKNQVYYVKTKHIDVRFHFVRDILEEGDISYRRFTGRRIPPIYLSRLFKE